MNALPTLLMGLSDFTSTSIFSFIVLESNLKAIENKPGNLTCWWTRC